MDDYDTGIFAMSFFAAMLSEKIERKEKNPWEQVFQHIRDLGVCIPYKNLPENLEELGAP